MTMPHEKKVSIWNKVHKDRDVDDMIFESEKHNEQHTVTVSDR